MENTNEQSTQDKSYTLEQRRAIQSVMQLSSKLVEAIPQNNDSFLWELLELALRSIPEADYGSISIIDEDSWRFVAAKGHSWELLKSIPLRPQYTMKFEGAEHKLSSNTYIIDEILEQDIQKMPPEVQKKLLQASMPIKQSLVAEICFNGQCKGHICLDIGVDSHNRFNEASRKMIKPIGDLAAAYLMMRENYLMVDNLGQVVNNRTTAVRNLLDNVGQGLLTFGADLMIHQDYSYECVRIFEKNIEGCIFPHIIHGDSLEEIKFMEQVLQEVFCCKDRFRVHVYLSLLPKEVVLKDKYIDLEYKLVNNIYKPEEKALMVILTEVTEKRLLENKVREDEKIMRMVANVAGNSQSFMECVKEFQYFYGSRLHDIVTSKQSLSSMYADIFREIHTFKGSFSQFDMFNSVEQLNAMESALSYMGNMMSKFTYQDFCGFIYSFDIMDFLEKDMEILREKLGAEFFSIGDMVYVEKSKLTEIENEIIDVCSPVESRILLPMVKQLRFKSLKSMLHNYIKYTMKLAERLEKPINPFVLEGEDVLVDSDKYGSFIKSLVHVFRNCVDHGLEAGETRLRQGKQETGNIRCSVNTLNGMLEILIEDDGSGIDFEQVRKKAAASGLVEEKQAEKLDEEHLIKLIFKDNFSTKEKITDVSGRGMGLYAVKMEIDRLGGTVELITNKHEGTALRFLLPIQELKKPEVLTSEAFAQPLLSTFMDFFRERFGTELNIRSIIPINASGFSMMNYTSFINIRGLFDGLFALSMDFDLSRALMQRLVNGEVDIQLEDRYIKDVIAESTNMILGNSIKAYPGIEEMIIIGTPSVICGCDTLSYEGNDIRGYKVETDVGTAVICIIQ